MKKAFALILILICILVGCQATPKQPVVIGKQDFAEKIVSADESSYKAPDNWQEEFTSKDQKLSVFINAPVVVPDVDAFPVVRIRPMVISQEQADWAIEALLGGETLYETKTVKTKQEIEEEILNIRKHIADPNADFNAGKDAHPDYHAEVLADFEAQIRTLEKEYETAPDTYVPQKSSGIFESGKDMLIMPPTLSQEEWDQIPDYGVIEGEADLGNEKPAILTIMSDDHYRNNRIIFFSSSQWMVINCQYENVPSANDLCVSEIKAIGLAKDVIAKINLGDMEPTVIGYTTMQNGEENKESILLHYTRNVMGMPTNYVAESDYKRNEPIYSAPWFEEKLEVRVDDAGMYCFFLANPIEVTEVVADNAAILSFERIQEIFREQIQYTNLWFDDPAIESRRIYITKAVLGMVKVAEQNNREEGLLVPAWDLMGYSVYKYGPNASKEYYGLDENNEYTYNPYALSMITINAIDGSIIERTLEQ